MPKVAIDAHLINLVVEQLDFWRDSLQSDEDKSYITELMGDLESANSSANMEAHKVIDAETYRMLEKHVDLDELWQESCHG